MSASSRPLESGITTKAAMNQVVPLKIMDQLQFASNAIWEKNWQAASHFLDMAWTELPPMMTRPLIPEMPGDTIRREIGLQTPSFADLDSDPQFERYTLRAKERYLVNYQDEVGTGVAKQVLVMIIDAMAKTGMYINAGREWSKKDWPRLPAKASVTTVPTP